ncbi:unnamed protein product [Brugia timori]|uniref:General odorant-binding protein 57e n=1 Tax=Brugia timori TaxID=42155 RepID=A0A0R3QAR4_9BILA|nr:unnamed protein product [Brugia timori]
MDEVISDEARPFVYCCLLYQDISNNCTTKRDMQNFLETKNIIPKHR